MRQCDGSVCTQYNFSVNYVKLFRKLGSSVFDGSVNQIDGAMANPDEANRTGISSELEKIRSQTARHTEFQRTFNGKQQCGMCVLCCFSSFVIWS